MARSGLTRHAGAGGSMNPAASSGVFLFAAALSAAGDPVSGAGPNGPAAQGRGHRD